MAETLQFNQPKMLKYGFEIFRGNEKVGGLTYAKIRHNRADAELDGVGYLIKQTGIAGNNITITETESGKTSGSYHEPVLGRTGQLDIDGKKYTFGNYGKFLSLKSKYAWTDAEGNAVITYQLGGFAKSKGEIVISDAAMDLPDRNLLVLLGLFNSLAREEDSVAVVGA